MSDTNSDDRVYDATPRRLQQARERGEVAVSREGSAAGVYVAALVGVIVTGGVVARHIGDMLMPLLDQSSQLPDMNGEGLRQAGFVVMRCLGLAVAPFFGLLIAGALLPYVLQGSITLAPERFAFNASHLSPGAGLKRMFSPRGLFEFGKHLAKAVAVAAACFAVVRPIFRESAAFVTMDFALLPGLLRDTVVDLLLAATLVAVVIAGIDVPVQHLLFHRRMRMTLQELKDELRSSEGDPRLKARLKRLRRQRSRRRMMHAVPKATVVITNPTHYAVALKYQRGKDTAPVVVAKGTDLIALRIRQVALENGVAVMQSPPLARALHAAVEIDEAIPREHFEAVAKIIGIVWARRQQSHPPDARKS